MSVRACVQGGETHCQHIYSVHTEIHVNVRFAHPSRTRVALYPDYLLTKFKTVKVSTFEHRVWFDCARAPELRPTEARALTRAPMFSCLLRCPHMC
jgi:hypothetical protein